MLFGWFKKKQKSCLGIDFGSSVLKVAELSRENERVVLKNYAVAKTPAASGVNLAKLSSDDTASLLQKIFDQAGIQTRQAVISLSVDETFSTIINIPAMREEELAKSIPFEARKYVPVPIEEVVLDWSVVGEFIEQSAPKTIGDSLGQSLPPQANQAESGTQTGQAPGATKTMQVLIVAVPQEIIRKIAQIAKKAGIKVLAVEQEAFSIIRALVGKDGGTYLLIDMGGENIDLIILDKGSIRLTLTFEKKDLPDLPAEAIKIIASYENRYSRKVGRVILTGGGVTEMKGTEILTQKLGIPVDIGNPFARLVADTKLAQALKEIEPFMAVAVGAAMREI